MPSSVFKCVKPADVDRVSKVAADYKKMGNLNSVRRAARTAGQYLSGQMTKLVEGESSLSSYQDVGRGFRVFQDEGNIVVGIPPEDPLAPKAWEMDAIYQVATVAHDLATQAGDVEEKFYDSLFSVVMQ